ncbi:MAG: hypothetical protein RBU23_11075 [Candidatus Auribacterota bacterium]|jgi:hypothetical protein|nr:hypothetical protein [Candidatus Auribacterota bacterium]
MHETLYYIKIYDTAFAQDDVCALFLEKICRLLRRSGGRLHAFCILPTHCHLLAGIAQNTTVRFKEDMQRIHTGKARYTPDCPQIKIDYAVVEKNFYAARVSCFIHALPVLTGISNDPAGYRWSSYCEYVGGCAKNCIVDHDIIKAQITRGYLRSGNAYFNYYGWFMRNCFENYSSMPDENGCSCIGTKRFARIIKSGKGQNVSSMPVDNGSISLDAIHSVVDRHINNPPEIKRLIKIYLAHTQTTLTNKKIGAGFGNISSSRVSQLIRQADKRMLNDSLFAAMIGKLEREFKRY